MINLSPSQKSIINIELGKPIQVLASAGSGKTRVLTERIRYILDCTKKEGVIALTFTNKAAEEMQSRLYDIEELENRCWITTIHSLAQRILNEYGNTIGLPSDLHIFEKSLDLQTIFIQSLVNNNIDVDAFFASHGAKDRSKKIQSYMDKFSSYKKDLLIEEEIKSISLGDDNLLPIFFAYQETLLASGGIDFDDILVYAHKILLERPLCGDIYRAKYKHICIDEAQDLNNAQYEFIKVFCGEKIHNIFMVGDPNQMIYGFNGSSNEYLCNKFVNDFSPLQFVLKENFRSSKAIIKLANKLKPLSQTETNFALEGKSEIKYFPTEDSEANWICDKISELITKKIDPEIEGDISLNNMVVIARNRFVFKALESALKKNEINYSLKQGERQSEPSSVFGKVLDLALRIKINPKDWINRKKLCSVLEITPPENPDISSILFNFSEMFCDSNDPFHQLQLSTLNKINELNLETPEIRKFCKYFYSFLDDLVKDVQLAKKNSEEMLAEIERSMQELNEFRTRWVLFKKKGLGGSLVSFRNAMALGKIFVEDDTRGITLSTVHTMKGLEKDIVFLTSMSEGIFPDYRAISQSNMNEEINNAFVAVTRARRWIYITYSNQKTMPWGGVKMQKPSRFIAKMQAD